MDSVTKAELMPALPGNAITTNFDMSTLGAFASGFGELFCESRKSIRNYLLFLVC